YDKRGPGYVGETHFIEVNNLWPATTYYYRIVSGSSIEDNSGLGYTFTTAPIPDSTCPVQPSCLPYKLNGTVYLNGAGTATPAAGALVYVTIHNLGSG